MSNDETRSYNQLVEDNIRLLAENEELKVKLGLAHMVNTDLQKTAQDREMRPWAYCPDKEICDHRR